MINYYRPLYSECDSAFSGSGEQLRPTQHQPYFEDFTPKI